MLHPSYTDLMKVVNKDIEEGESKIVNSRYSIVLATSKRARQIIDGDIPLVMAKGEEKPLSIAIRELKDEQLKILAENSSSFNLAHNLDYLYEQDLAAQEQLLTAALLDDDVEFAYDPNLPLEDKPEEEDIISELE